MLRIALAITLLGAILGACETTTPQATDMNVTYEKTGGFLPFQDSLVVHGDGAIVYTDRTHKVRQAHVNPSELQKLRSLLASNDFQQASPEYRADRGADLVTHKIDARLGASSKTVVVMDSTEHPKALDQIIDELERLAGLTREP